MTAESDIAAIDDGGANTAAEVRTALTSVLSRAGGPVTDWSPSIRSGTNTPTQTVVFARYSVIETLALVSFRINVTGSSASGDINITNIPADLQSLFDAGTQSISARFGDTSVGFQDGILYVNSANQWNFRRIDGGSNHAAPLANGDSFWAQGIFAIDTS